MARYSKAHAERSRLAIRDSGARLFRRRGYAGVGIDELCREAGLTRGAFYSHFRSKSALLTAVLAGSHDFVRRLRARAGKSTSALRRQAADVAAAYLAPANRSAVLGGCSLAALAADTSRAEADAQAAYAEAVRSVVAEFRRADGDAPMLPLDDARVALALCVGGVLISGACGDDPEGRRVARAATTAVRRLLTENGEDHS